MAPVDYGAVGRALFLALVGAVAAARLIELAISRRRRRALAERGARTVPEPHFGAMVLVHAGILAGAAAETLALERRPWPWISAAALALVAGANALRVWVIAALGPHWNVRIMDSVGALGVVTRGPYRLVRHPNYAAVFLELLALPLVHGAWATALAGALFHAWVLFHRVRAEEAMLLAHPGYRAALGGKPRFLPALRWNRRST